MVLKDEKAALAEVKTWSCFDEAVLLDGMRFNTLKAFVEAKFEAIKQQMEGPSRNDYLKGRLDVCEEILREAESIGAR